MSCREGGGKGGRRGHRFGGMVQGRRALDSAKLNVLEALHLQLDQLVLLLQLLLQLCDQLLVRVQFALLVAAQHSAICKLLLQVAALAG